MANKSNVESIAERNRTPQDLGPKSVVQARVVANFGDPGLTEQYFFDILSRFVIVMIEPAGRVPNLGNKYRLFALVRRPLALWVNVDGGVTSDPADQMRSDISANINVGAVDAFSIENIGQINRPYHLGEKISIRKLNKPIYANKNFFRSEFEDIHWTSAKVRYNEPYLTQDPAGSQRVFDSPKWDEARIYPLFPITEDSNGKKKRSLYINGNLVQDLASRFKYNTSYRTKGSSFKNTGFAGGTSDIDIEDPEFRYAIGLKKFQFEIFWRFHHAHREDAEDYDKIIHDYLLSDSRNRSMYHNDYMWNNQWSNNYKRSSVVWNNCAWEDVNVDNKARNVDNECQPLIVLSPNTFPTPKTRAAGSFKFDPTYTKIILPDEE